jgi:uncharacterized OB-fold protein
MSRRICAVCGTEQMPNRKDAIYCGASCRAEQTRLRRLRQELGVPVSSLFALRTHTGRAEGQKPSNAAR